MMQSTAPSRWFSVAMYLVEYDRLSANMFSCMVCAVSWVKQATHHICMMDPKKDGDVLADAAHIVRNCNAVGDRRIESTL